MAFRGWPPEAYEFYLGLEADNSKTYWELHKAVYEEAVRHPMLELLDELAGEFGEGRIFRPYRDMRFSRDKSPYKTAIGATLIDGGYVQFSTQGLAAACGIYQMAPDQLDRYRAAVADDTTGAELARLVATLRAQGIEVAAHESLKTAPRGYSTDHPRIALLRHKGLVTWRQWAPGAWLSTPSAKDRVVEFLRASRPMRGWLDSHVGPSAVPAGDRRR
ncbi:MAG TPA: DUF2461 domain-containing protein [Micromonosporaceae bacterium]